MRLMYNEQAKPTETTNNDANALMDYVFTHPAAKLRYVKSDMQLHVDSDAAYLVAPKAKSRVAGYYNLSDKQTENNTTLPTYNAPVHIECALLKHIISSAAEAGTGRLFHDTQIAIGIIKILEALGHKQDTIKVNIDNSTAAAFNNSTLKEKKSKTWDMRSSYLNDKTKSNQFQIYWDRGVNNYADY